MENFRILICLIPFGILCHSAPQFDNLNQGKVIVRVDRDSQVVAKGVTILKKDLNLGRLNS